MNRFITAFDLFTTGLSQHLLHSIGSQHRPLKDPTRLPHARRQGLVAGVPQREALARRRGPAPVVAAVCRPRARLSTWVYWVDAHRLPWSSRCAHDRRLRTGRSGFFYKAMLEARGPALCQPCCPSTSRPPVRTAAAQVFASDTPSHPRARPFHPPNPFTTLGGRMPGPRSGAVAAALAVAALETGRFRHAPGARRNPGPVTCPLLAL